MRFLSFVVLMLLMTGCARYTIGAENAAPRVVSGEVKMTEAAGSHGEEATHSAEGEQSEAMQAEAHDAEHSVMLPELESAMTVVRGAFDDLRGSKTARHEAAETLEAARQSVYALYEAGTISHGSELDEYFETAIEKVAEGTNDAPNALTRLIEKLEKAGKH